MSKIYLVLVVLAVVLILLFAFFYFLPNPVAKAPIQTLPLGISVLNPKPNQVISSPLTIIGSVSGQGWAGFEGQVGTVRLIDESGKGLGLAILTTTTEWTQLPTDFKTSLEFTAPGGGGSGYLVFRNENASGEPERDREYKLPITFK